LKRNNLDRPPKNLKQIIQSFIILNDEIANGAHDATYIGRYIYDNITCEKLNTKISASNFEEFLAFFFGGKKMDKEDRKKIKVVVKFSKNEDINRRVTRNKLEKLDVMIGGIELSAKTLIPKNNELNIGSFSAEALFDGFLPSIPNERDTLGSKPLLNKIFNQIKTDGNWGKFVDRFIAMIKSIYVTHLIVAIKSDKVLEVYLLPKEKFRSYFIQLVKSGPDQIISFMNRFEAHAIRTQREPIINNSYKVHITLFGKSTEKLDKIINTTHSMRIDAINSLIYKDQKEDRIKSLDKRYLSLIEFLKKI
jgi:hypothetical protein